MFCKLKNTPEVGGGTEESSHVDDDESEGQCRANMFLGLSASFNVSRRLLASSWLESSWLTGAWPARSLTPSWLDDCREELLNLAKNWKKLRRQPKEKATFLVQPKDDQVIYETHLTVQLPGYACNDSSRVSVLMKRALQQTSSFGVWIIYVHNMQVYSDPLPKITSGNNFSTITVTVVLRSEQHNKIEQIFSSLLRISPWPQCWKLDKWVRMWALETDRSSSDPSSLTLGHLLISDL